MRVGRVGATGEVVIDVEEGRVRRPSTLQRVVIEVRQLLGERELHQQEEPPELVLLLPIPVDGGSSELLKRPRQKVSADAGAERSQDGNERGHP